MTPDPELRARHYERLPVDEVWGIGGQAGAKLAAAGIATIADFVRADPRVVRDMLTVTGARVQTELRGASCLPLSLMAPARKGIAVSRSFGHMIDKPAELREAICTFAARAAEKLRAEGLEAGQIAVFTHTNPHNGDPWYSAQRQAKIEPTADTGLLIGEAIRLLRAVWRPGYRYFKAGVMLQDLAPARRQAVLFATFDREKSAATMKVMDAINARFGRGTLRIASTTVTPAWGARRQNLSPRYTTQAGEMLLAVTF